MSASAANRLVVIDAASGVTGAGRSAKRELLFGEVAEDYRAYGVGNRHRHVPEIGAGLGRMNGHGAPAFVFTPHLLPVDRGLMASIYIELEHIAPNEAQALYEDLKPPAPESKLPAGTPDAHRRGMARYHHHTGKPQDHSGSMLMVALLGAVSVILLIWAITLVF